MADIIPKHLYETVGKPIVQFVGAPRSLIQSTPQIKAYVEDAILYGGFTVLRGGKVWFPILADEDMTVSRLRYLLDNGASVRQYHRTKGIMNEFPSWIELPYAARLQDVPAYVRGATYTDEEEVEQTRTWEEWSGNFMRTALDNTKVLLPLSFGGAYIPADEAKQLADDADALPSVTVMMPYEASALLAPGGAYTEEEVI